MDTLLTDPLDRPLHDLRISVTDRCNFRCVYCMPKSVFDKNYRFLSRSELLNFEEIERVARVFVVFGVRKLRITGGEPLIRHQLEVLIERLAAIPGVEDMSMSHQCLNAQCGPCPIAARCWYATPQYQSRCA